MIKSFTLFIAIKTEHDYKLTEFSGLTQKSRYVSLSWLFLCLYK